MTVGDLDKEALEKAALAAPGHTMEDCMELAEPIVRAYLASLAPSSGLPGEAEAKDAPCYYGAEQADAWAAGFNSARDRLSEAFAAKEAETKRLKKRVETLERMDREAATYVESVICMRTRFTGDPPYVGWKGLGLALTEELDERDALRAAAALSTK